MKQRSLPASMLARFLGWSMLMLAVLAVFTWRVLPQVRVETDVLALLPQAQHDRDMEAALDKFSAQLARRQIFLVGSDSLANAKLAASGFARELQSSGAFEQVQLELDDDLRQRADAYFPHRAYLLSPEDAQRLGQGRADELMHRALRTAYTPAGLMQPFGLAQDPLGVLNDFIRSQALATGRARLEGSMLVVEDGNRTYVLVLTENKGSPFASSVQEQVMPAIEQARIAASRAVQAPVEIISSGAIQHAAVAATRAEHEVSTFGTIELIAVIVLLLLVFGGMRPLLLGALTLSLAVVSAFTAVHVVFGHVHLLALVFGSSLIGSIIDYSIHFFADRFRDPARWTPVEAVRHVGPAILLGLTTTLIGYVVLAIVPFPGLKQIALFCMVGVAVGCGCVLCLYPLLARTRSRRVPRLGTRIGGSLNRLLLGWRWSAMKIATFVILGVLVVTGLMRLKVQDDVKALQESPAQLVAQEQRVRELLGSGIETRFFIVTGESAEAVLESEQQLGVALDRLVRDGALASYQAVNRALPSQAEQKRNHQLLAQNVYAPGAAFDQIMTRLGFAPEVMEQRRAEFASGSPLGVQQWLDSPASQGLRHLWLGQVGSQYATIVTLGGIGDVAALNAVNIPGVRLIDRVAETTTVLGSYRKTMTWLLAVVYAVAGVVLLIRFGWRDAPRMLLPSIAATLATLGLFGWLGIPFNLFTLLALWLVLGLGIDYGIFLRHGRENRPTAILSVTLSACTTLIAFGLLSLSATPFIRSMGMTLLCAIILSWAFVLLSCMTGRTKAEAIHG